MGAAQSRQRPAVREGVLPATVLHTGQACIPRSLFRWSWRAISKERLRTLRVMVPTAQLQETFAQRVAALHVVAQQQDAALPHAKATFAALLARAFGQQAPSKAC